MDRTLIGALFVVLVVAVVIWQLVQRGRDIADAPDRAPVTPESPALAIISGAGDLRGTGLQNDGSTAEHESNGGAREAEGRDL